MKSNKGCDRAADWKGGAWRKEAARNLISQDCSCLSRSAPSCLLTPDMLKMKSSGSLWLEVGPQWTWLEEKKWGGGGMRKERERDGGCRGLWVPHTYGTTQDGVFLKGLRFSPFLSLSSIPPLVTWKHQFSTKQLAHYNVWKLVMKWGQSNPDVVKKNFFSFLFG